MSAEILSRDTKNKSFPQTPIFVNHLILRGMYRKYPIRHFLKRGAINETLNVRVADSLQDG